MNNYFGNRTPAQRLRGRLAKDELTMHGYHSISYHSFFEDYVESREMDAGGRVELVRRYKGDYYFQQLSPMGYVGIRILYSAAAAGMTGLTVSAVRMQGRSTVYTTFAEFLMLLAFAYLVYTLTASYLFAPRQMTIGDYKASSIALLKGALWTAAGFWLAGSMRLILFFTGGFARIELVNACIYEAGALLALSIRILEKRVPYRSDKNDSDQVGKA